MSTAPRAFKPTAANVNRVLIENHLRSSNVRAGLRATTGFEAGIVNLSYDCPLGSTRMSDDRIADLFARATAALAERGLTTVPHPNYARRAIVSASV